RGCARHGRPARRPSGFWSSARPTANGRPGCFRGRSAGVPMTCSRRPLLVLPRRCEPLYGPDCTKYSEVALELERNEVLWSSLECSPPCQGGGRGFKSRQDRRRRPGVRGRRAFCVGGGRDKGAGRGLPVRRRADRPLGIGKRTGSAVRTRVSGVSRAIGERAVPAGAAAHQGRVPVWDTPVGAVLREGVFGGRAGAVAPGAAGARACLGRGRRRGRTGRTQRATVVHRGAGGAGGGIASLGA